MTAQILSSELTAIFQESKKKNPELRNAAEKSLHELKALPQTSEAQLAADLRNRPTVIRPLVIACNSRNVKVAGSGINCLQRLIVTKALPKACLKDVLGAFRDCSSLALVIQLKVLQALPALLQNYGATLSGGLLADAFQVCFLLHGSGTAVVSNTAAAALQQLVTATFEKAASGENSPTSDDHSYEISTTEGEVSVRGAAADAYQLLNDLCLMIEGQRPSFLTAGSLTQNFGLELIESVLTNYADTLSSHPEQIHVLRSRLMPLMLKIMSDKGSFALTVRVLRLLQLILNGMLFALAAECEEALGLLIAMLDPTTSLWKRALALEVFRGIHTNPTLVRSMYGHFDEQSGRRNIVCDHFSSLVRLAAEKPTVIGLGLHLSSSMRAKDDSDEHADATVGSTYATAGTTETENTGLSARWSMPRTACIDMIDKAEPPNIPSTYIYALALFCINSFPDGLARFLLPLTATPEVKSKRKPRTTQENGSSPTEVDEYKDNVQQLPFREGGQPKLRSRPLRSRKDPINPLSLVDHVLYRQIRTSAHMVEHCWPALLAVYSTFLNAALDTEYFHALIRALQKFIQIAGVLDFSTPRDAFLTTLSKSAIPASKGISHRPRNSLDYGLRKDPFDESDRDSSPAISPRPKTSSDLGIPSITSRNLLCLRALLNLGIALGPLLKQSWSIVLETWRQAELLLPRSSAVSALSQPSRQSSRAQVEQSSSEKFADGEDLGVEIAAAETAATRMIEGTNDYLENDFLVFTKCLCSLFHSTPTGSGSSVSNPADDLLSTQTSSRKHIRFPSMIEWTPDGYAQQENLFTLAKVHELIQCNISRLSDARSANPSWVLLTGELKAVLSTQSENPSVRVKAAEIFVDMAVTMGTFTVPESDKQDLLRTRALNAIEDAIATVCKKIEPGLREFQNCGDEIHRLLLEGVRSILEQSGESVVLGWSTIFKILIRTLSARTVVDSVEKIDLSSLRTTSAKLVRSSFGSLQLVCSDYLQFVPLACLHMLIDTLYLFCSQPLDLNISLTTSSFFANVSNFLQRQKSGLSFEGDPESYSSVADLAQHINFSTPSTSALWLLLISRMQSLLTDERSEVRHSVLHTLLRIFGDCSDQLDPDGWRISFDLVLCQILTANQKQYDQVSKATGMPEKDNFLEQWNMTAAAMVDGVTRVFIQNLDTMIQDHDFQKMWSALLHCLRLFLGRQVLHLSASVFAGFTGILEEVDNAEAIGKAAVNEAWFLWKDCSPVQHAKQASISDQDALMAYLRCIPQIYRLMGLEARNNRAGHVMDELHACVICAEVPAYSSDIDRMTPIQKGVLENLRIIPTDQQIIRWRLTDFLATLVVKPYEHDRGNSGKGATFVALSKAAVASLQLHTISHGIEATVASCGLVTRALDALAVPIHLKYSWCIPSKEQPTWRLATTAAVNILEACMPSIIHIHEPGEEVNAFWEQVVRVLDGVVAADCEVCTNTEDILMDQDFDIEAASRILELVMPALWSSHVSEGIRCHCIESLFEKSLIHEPHPDDLARPGDGLLDGLKYHHIGRTQDLPPTPRSKMSYILLDQLFLITAVQNGSPERIRLAQTAAPYLILRCGLKLKAYVYDQPLRGRMPQPWSQKRELYYILQKMTDLDLEPRAMQDIPDVISEHKKHLIKLYPLLTRALKAAFRDQEMTRALSDVLEVVGRHFGV